MIIVSTRIKKMTRILRITEVTFHVAAEKKENFFWVWFGLELYGPFFATRGLIRPGPTD